MAAQLESLDSAPFLAGKVEDVSTGVLFKTQSYAKGLKLVETFCSTVLLGTWKREGMQGNRKQLGLKFRFEY